MADILFQPAVPSLFTHTESASSLIVDSPTADSNNNTTIHHTRASSNTNNNNHSNNPSTTNKYIGHVSRLRSVFTQYALTLNDLKPGEHRSRYSNHHHQDPVSPTRGIADGADNKSLSPSPAPLPLVTTSSSTLIERSRSLSNPRILDNNTSNMNSMRSGISSITVNENPVPINNSNDDHTVRFRKAKEMFQTLEEEATRTSIPLSTTTTTTTTTTKQIINNRQNDNNETYQPDLMHDGQKIILPKINSEHIPDLINDHRQQMEHSPKNHDLNSNRIRDIPIQFMTTPSSPPPTHTDRSFTSIPVHRAVPSPISNEDIPYAMVNRKHFNSDQHYDFPKESTIDFPADAIEQIKKHQHEDTDSTKASNEEIANRIVASILPSNILKRMDHLNTVFIKPTAIDRSVPKLPFQESDISHENNSVIQDEEGDEQQWIENPMLNSKRIFLILNLIHLFRSGLCRTE